MNKLIIIAGILVVVLILVLALVWPKYQDFQLLQSNIKEKDAELQSKTEYFSQVKEISEELVQYQEPLAKVSSALPQEPSLASLFSFLQRTAAQTGLIVKEVSLGGIIVPKESSQKEIRVSLLLNGAYSALKDFLLAVEISSRMIEIESVSFRTPKDLEDPFSFSIKLKTQSY